MIHKYLDLSTGHVSRETMDRLTHIGSAGATRSVELQALGWPAMTVAAYDHGVFITVPPHEGEEAMPLDLALVLRHAGQAGAQLVRLDSDGTVHDGLDFYEW